MTDLNPTVADKIIASCIDEEQSFSVIAGAGSGKTTSLIEALKKIREKHGPILRKNGQKVICITYTNRAVRVISSRLKFDELYYVTTLHGFLWAEVSRFQTALREGLIKSIIPAHIEKAQKDDNGGNSKKAQKAREKVQRLEYELQKLEKDNPLVKYEETIVSDYSKCILNHDDVIDISSYIISNKVLLQKGLGFKYPYIFVDEAQDTFPQVMNALNMVCSRGGLPIVGYFGDPMQQIYDQRAGEFYGPDGAKKIKKKENFRCSVAVINLLNKFRTDVQQIPAGENAQIEGSVEITVARAPNPEGPRRTYTQEQLTIVSEIYNNAIEKWEWNNIEHVKNLFLARQMIARRLKFIDLHRLFTGEYSSSRSQSDYEDGSHYLLKPFIDGIYLLIHSAEKGDVRRIIEVLHARSPAFRNEGTNKGKSLKFMLDKAMQHVSKLRELWCDRNVKDILEYCKDNEVISISEKLSAQLNRDEREEFIPGNEDHQKDKGDWLADAFFRMSCEEIGNYIGFLDEKSPYSTQHGSKGEEYKNVIVVIDDVEASWNSYSFGKVLTPETAGEPTPRQDELTRRLAYVCFSRAEVDLRILFFSQKPEEAGRELVNSGLFLQEQISYI